MIHCTFLQLTYAGNAKKNQNKNKPQNQTGTKQNKTKQESSVSKTCPGNSVQLELQKGLLESLFFSRY